MLAINLMRRCHREQGGMAATEFALVLPFLLLLCFGGIELTDGVIVNRQVGLTADTITNIVAQYTTISASQQMPDILNASVQIFAPNPSSAATVVVSLVGVDSNGKATVTWSQALNGTARPAGQPLTLPGNLAMPNTNLVFGETSYAYTPWFDFINIGAITLSASVYMSPRASTTINLVP